MLTYVSLPAAREKCFRCAAGERIIAAADQHIINGWPPNVNTADSSTLRGHPGGPGPIRRPAAGRSGRPNAARITVLPYPLCQIRWCR
jgi:hypothetical protein